MEKDQKAPHYGKRTKVQVVEEYLGSSASFDELSGLHGILGSNTVANWLKKYGNSGPKSMASTGTGKPHAPAGEKDSRRKRCKSDEQLYIGELEADLETARQRVRFYAFALSIVNGLAKELTGIDLLKKTGQELSARSARQES